MRGSGAHVRRTYAAMSRDIVDDLATVPSPDDMRRSTSPSSSECREPERPESPPREPSLPHGGRG